MTANSTQHIVHTDK